MIDMVTRNGIPFVSMTLSKQKLNSFDSWYSYLLDGRINGSKNMFMSVTRMLKLPRNYGFVQRLPQKFALKVLKKRNPTGGGAGTTWRSTVMS